MTFELKGHMDSGRGLVIVGCDPGPERSAFAFVRHKPNEDAELLHAAYLDNDTLDSLALWASFRCASWNLDGLPLVLAYEGVGAQGKFCGESTFETAAMGGEIRRLFRPHVAATYRFISSEWRHALTGQGNARTPLIYHELCKFFPPTGGGADKFKGTKDAPGPLWRLHEAGKGGNVEHLKDALGVALGLTLVNFRSGRDPEEYRRPW